MQVNFLNRAMMLFGASEVVPVYFVIFTLCTVCAGMVLYLEGEHPFLLVLGGGRH